MKILVISHTFLPKYLGGTEVYTFELAKELISQGHNVEILCSDPLSKKTPYSISQTKYRGINVNIIEKNILNYKSFSQTYLDEKVDELFEQFIKTFKPDVIHYLHLMHLSVNLINIANRYGIKQVATLNDFWMQTHLFNRVAKNGKLYEKHSVKEDALELSKELNSGMKIDTPISFGEFFKCNDKKLFINAVTNKSLNRLFGQLKKHVSLNKYIKLINDRNRLIKHAMRKLDLIVFPTVFLFQEFCDWGFQTKKVIISEHGIDTALFKNFKKKSTKTIRFAFIGAIIPAKGLDILLKAWNNIDSSNAELKIYGNFKSDKKYSRSLKKLLTNLINIKLKGTFDPKDIAQIFSEIDVLILPSRWFENGPLVLRNALLSKTPVIATRLGSNPEFIRDGYNGLLFKNEDINDLSNKISLIIKNKKLINSMSSNIQDQKSIKEDASNLLNYYQELIKS